MPWFLYPCQAAGGVLALEAYQVVRASSVFDGLCPIEPPPIHVTPFPCSRLWLSSCFGNHVCERGRQVRVLDLCTGPLIMCIG